MLKQGFQSLIFSKIQAIFSMAGLRSVVSTSTQKWVQLFIIYRKTLIIHFLDASRHINQGEIFNQSTYLTVPNKRSNIHIFFPEFFYCCMMYTSLRKKEKNTHETFHILKMKTHFEKEPYFENESTFLKKGHCRAQNSILFTNLSGQINLQMFQRKAPLQNRNCETKLQHTNGYFSVVKKTLKLELIFLKIKDSVFSRTFSKIDWQAPLKTWGHLDLHQTILCKLYVSHLNPNWHEL